MTCFFDHSSRKMHFLWRKKSFWKLVEANQISFSKKRFSARRWKCCWLLFILVARLFGEWKFCQKDILPKGHFAKEAFCIMDLAYQKHTFCSWLVQPRLAALKLSRHSAIYAMGQNLWRNVLFDESPFEQIVILANCNCNFSKWSFWQVSFWRVVVLTMCRTRGL